MTVHSSLYMTTQGGPSGCTLPFVDIKTIVPSQHSILIFTKMQLSICYQQNIVYNLLDHPVHIQFSISCSTVKCQLGTVKCGAATVTVLPTENLCPKDVSGFGYSHRSVTLRLVSHESACVKKVFGSRGVMTPTPESESESDFHHFSEIVEYNSNSNSGKNWFSYCSGIDSGYWNRFQNWISMIPIPIPAKTES